MQVCMVVMRLIWAAGKKSDLALPMRAQHSDHRVAHLYRTEVAARASQAGKACQAAGATQNGGGSRQQLVLQRAVTVEESYEQAYDYERRRYGGNRGSALRLQVIYISIH